MLLDGFHDTWECGAATLPYSSVLYFKYLKKKEGNDPHACLHTTENTRQSGTENSEMENAYSPCTIYTVTWSSLLPSEKVDARLVDKH